MAVIDPKIYTWAESDGGIWWSTSPDADLCYPVVYFGYAGWEAGRVGNPVMDEVSSEDEAMQVLEAQS